MKLHRTLVTCLATTLSAAALAGSGKHALAATLTANAARNIWAHAVIFCGHFPAGADTFTEEQIEGETRGDWYVRQMIGSANISGSRLMHLMTGNLSFQIEHHLFPDLPSNRYAEVAVKVREICERYELPYTTGPLPKQVASAWSKIIRLSLPNGWLKETTLRNAPAQVAKLFRRDGRVADFLAFFGKESDFTASQ